jgi:hypothetical protein
VPEPDDDHEILQEFLDLHSVVQSTRSFVKRMQQTSSPAHSTAGVSPAHSTAGLKQLRDDLNRVSALPRKILNYCMVLEREVTTLRGMVKEELIRTASSEVLEENRQFLATLTVAQIIKMLEMLNMKKYQDKFAEEGIDGTILTDIEEHTLETGLGVTSKLDRVKLMKIMKGERSAKSVLEGQYNYVALQPPR